MGDEGSCPARANAMWRVLHETRAERFDDAMRVTRIGAFHSQSQSRDSMPRKKHDGAAPTCGRRSERPLTIFIIRCHG